MADSPGEMLGVKETARRLNVHENTVRNWEATGVLPGVRLSSPSRYRRFRAADVERLKELQDSGQLDQERKANVVLARHELEDLITVARMYLGVFADAPPHGPHGLYQRIAGIVRHYGEAG